MRTTRRRPGSGILVVEGDEAVERAANSWGLCRDSEVRGLPLAQSRMAKVERTTEYLIAGDGDISSEAFVKSDAVVFVPIVGLPLSSNRYYDLFLFLFPSSPSYRRMVSACSKEEDRTGCCGRGARRRAPTCRWGAVVPASLIEVGIGRAGAGHVAGPLTLGIAAGGDADGDADMKRIERVERHAGRDSWDRFGCYLLVEMFVLRRMDGSVALTHDFRIRTLWS
uniref:Uncharacterized protein n=1 Tax=Oryza brachyantha TaxID=4533 RepID=J3MSY2_ORYBR